MTMNYGAVVTMVGAIVNLSLACFVLLQNPKAAVTRTFFLLGLSFAVWNYGTHWMFRVQNEEDALFWARFLQFGVIFIPLTFCHLSFQIARIPLPKKLLIGAYSAHVLLFLSNFTGFFLSGVKNVGYAWYSVAGTGFWILSGVFSLMWVSVGVLIYHRRRQPLFMRRRLTPLIVAQTSFALWGCNDVLPILGIYYYPFTHIQVYPVGSMAVIFYGMMVCYSVLQHQLLDVHVVMGRLAAHIVRMLFLLLIALALLIIVAAALPKEFTTTAFVSSLGVLLVSAILASVLFPKLLGGRSDSFERRILGDRFEHEDQVRNFIGSMSFFSDLPTLYKDLDQLLSRTFKLDRYNLVLRNETTQTANVVLARPEEAAKELQDFDIDAALTYFEWTKGEYLVLKGQNSTFRSSTTERLARQQLLLFKTGFCFPLLWQSETIGLLLVGSKTSGEPFTATDVMLLVELSKRLGMVVNQLRLKTQILEAQELDLLGKMSRGMAHDLNNLLTPVSTLLQLAEESERLDAELLPVAARNLATMRAYIREALFFSENLRPDLQPVQVDSLMHEAIDVAINSRPKAVQIIPRIASGVRAEVDGVLVQRLVANLITNAIDASPPDGQVFVSLDVFRATEQRDWLRIRIADRGEGIPRENLERIFTPYYTTKNHGDNTRGFGLGLAICRKIASLHGGSLSVESQVKKGTTVQLDLPTEPLAEATQNVTHIDVPTAA